MGKTKESIMSNPGQKNIIQDKVITVYNLVK